ncbi:ricin-type beta-trefoil lectin domain protein [Pendulispora albinea]|uniref:Ricin-type beta-trefoil lectin domain protein n=1 Tax=Pendulispora albinea TaxID=2741071 RepID=A0ABZ2M0S5_9BACT
MMTIIVTKKRSRTPIFSTLLALAGVLASHPARAANETVSVWLTTTDDGRGVHVVRGLQPQANVAFSAGTGGSGQNVTVDENVRYQRFIGGGASFTDTAAWLMNGSGALSAAARETVMQNLFNPTTGIGVGFLRNPMGASDLARYNYSYDDLPAGQTDPSLARFSIDHDLADVLPLTKRARAINPNVTIMASPWSSPAWMKDNGDFTRQGWLKAEYYGTYAQYFVKYLQAYRAQGVNVDYVSVQNEPTCCGPNTNYGSMNWNGAGLLNFTKNHLLPALHANGSTTKVLALDYNWGNYDDLGSTVLADAQVRADSLFGGIAWHGYGGDVRLQTTIHNQYPNVDAFDTEHSGGTWISHQQQEDMRNIIDYTRNWGRTVTKWSLAVDQNMGPHSGGCGTCTGLITVHNGDARHGQVDYTIEYYTMGHLTKFVKPGAERIDTNDNASVRNVAWRNPDGSKVLIAYNDTGSAQTLRVNWGGQSFAYTLPVATSATFTWTGTPGGGGGATGPITGLAGKCVDIAGGNGANGTAVQLYDCNGTVAQRWTVGTDGTVRALGKCLDVTSASTADGAKVQLYDCNGTGAQQWQVTAGRDLVNVPANKCLDVTDNDPANGARLQIWSCTGAANQKWTVPAN